MKILIAGDSLSMSRYVDDIQFEEIYPIIVQLNCPGVLVVNGSERSNSSRRIVTDNYCDEYLRPLIPDCVVIQIGIVDCAPRVFTDAEKRLLSIMGRIPVVRFIANLIVKLGSMYRLPITRKRMLTTVSSEEFYKNLCDFVEEIYRINPGCQLVMINIVCPGEKIKERSYGVMSSALKYNQILEEVASNYKAEIIDLYTFTQEHPEALLQDGYHIGKLAHRFIYDNLKKRILS